MTRIAALVLDFDGLLVESNGVKDEAFRTIFARYPEVESEAWAFHRTHVSRSRYDKFRHLVETLLGVPSGAGADARVEALVADFSALVAHRVAEVPEVPGATPFLRTWSQRLPLYLASMTPQVELEAIVERRGIRGYFREIFGCPPHRKDEVLRLCAEELGVETDAVIMIGDAPGDMEAAARAGAGFMGRDSGIPFPDDVPLVPDMHALSLELEALPY
ncbi:MAG: HAD hydrolase-like protein [Longimicrobiales bacterium]